VKPVVYQLVVRYFGNTNRTNAIDGTLQQNGCGRFADIDSNAIASLKALGSTHVWLTGVLRQATMTDHSDIGLPADSPNICKGRAGSFYAVRDYFDVCPDYAIDRSRRLEEFRELIDRLHAAGLQVIIDLVPNHVSRAYSTASTNPSFGPGDDQSKFFARDNAFYYLAQPAGQRLSMVRPAGWNPAGVEFTGSFGPEDGGPGRTPKASGDNVTVPWPGINNWYETIKLNYGWDFVLQRGCYEPRPRTWDVVDRILAFWQGLGVDGFRCDFAHYVPAEAWTWLLAQARSRRPAFFFAEAYPNQGAGSPIQDPDHELIAAGFNAVYDSGTYETLKKLYLGWNGIDAWADQVNGTQQVRPHLMSYLENHDERRIPSPVSQQTGGNGGESGFGSAAAAYQLAPLQFLHGTNPVMLLNGQEVGEPGANATGFKGDNGRSTFFDYWTMPVFADWVNDHAFDGGRLSAEGLALRAFYAQLLGLCQDPAIANGAYRDLRNGNRWGDAPGASSLLMGFARWIPGSGRLLLVVANLRPNSAEQGCIRLPADVVASAGLRAVPMARVLLGETKPTLGDPVRDGICLALDNQRTAVIELV
jgi:glycosidase